MERSLQTSIKRVCDIAGASSALLVLSPLLLLVALSVRATSAGPALFRQQRLGRHGLPFEIAKFRTMYVCSEDRRNPDGSAFSATDDPRVTRLGRILRATSLDELPQLWNVLVGDMSLVGPRPDQLDQMAFYRSNEFRKLAVRPGMTGLAQIRGRNRISWEARKQLDIEYIDRWSLSLDCRLLMETVPYVLLGRDVNQK